MQKITFDFEATKERIYAPNSNVPIGAPVDRNGNIANDGNAYGIVLCKETENEKYWVKYNLVVMVAGYCDIIDAQEIWGDEYSAEAIAAMSDITFCDNHELPTGGGGGWPADLPKPSVGGYGYTEQGEQVLFDGIAELEETDFDYYVGVLEMDGTLTVGSVCYVDFGGEEYQLTVHEVSARGTTANAIGNDVFIGGEDNGVPFLIVGSDTMGVMTSSVGGSKSLKVAQAAAVIHKINEKYLPVIPAAPSDDGTYTLTCTVTDGDPVYSWESAT